jgi:hypothetical protein
MDGSTDVDKSVGERCTAGVATPAERYNAVEYKLSAAAAAVPGCEKRPDAAFSPASS